MQKILNLKHAWEFILDRDAAASRSDYYILSYIARHINEGFFAEGGRIRGVPVTIGGSSYIPPLPNELDVKYRCYCSVYERALLENNRTLNESGPRRSHSFQFFNYTQLSNFILLLTP